jgi:hypothetical protein
MLKILKLIIDVCYTNKYFFKQLEESVKDEKVQKYMDDKSVNLFTIVKTDLEKQVLYLKVYNICNRKLKMYHNMLQYNKHINNSFLICCVFGLFYLSDDFLNDAFFTLPLVMYFSTMFLNLVFSTKYRKYFLMKHILENYKKKNL